MITAYELNNIASNVEMHKLMQTLKTEAMKGEYRYEISPIPYYVYDNIDTLEKLGFTVIYHEYQEGLTIRW